MKFTLYNYIGDAHSYYKVESEVLASSSTTVSNTSNAHLILVVDRSGSMWGSMDDVKRSIEAVLTKPDTAQKNLLVSLVSYSSVGDTTLHFSRAPIANLVAKNSNELKQIRRLSPTGLTCISGGLKEALSLVEAGETTMISLHSDGYANDDSSYTERQELNNLLSGNTNNNLSVHTIAHTSWSDFQTLSRIANSLSGSCVYARSSADVEAPLMDLLANASGPVEPPQTITKGDEDFVVFYSNQAQRLISGESDLIISGLPEGSDKTVYRFTKITKKEYSSLKVDVCGQNGDDNVLPLYIFSKATLALGKLNLSKYAMNTTRDTALIQAHFQALVNEDLAEMSSDIESIIFANDFSQRTYQGNFGFDNLETSVLEITQVLNRFASDLEVNIKKIRQNYVRRGLEKIPGHRDDDGNLIPPKYELQPIESDDFVEIVECEINQNTANINLTVSDPVQLVPVGKKKAITEVSGVDISELREFKAFTIVGDGRLNLSSLELKINDKRAFQALKKLDVVAGNYSAQKTYTIDLAHRPTLPLDNDYGSIGGIFNTVMTYRAFEGALRGLLKGSSTSLTGDQIKALRSHYITPSLNVSIPSTVPYTNLDDAISSGEVERRPSFIIDIGTTEIQNKSDFRSANQFLKTFYTFADGSEKPGTAPKWDFLKDANVSLARKKLTKKTKVSTADEFMLKIYDSLLGITSTDFVVDILKGLGKSALGTHIDAFAKRSMNATTLAGLEEIQDLLQEAMEDVYTSTISPLVFYIGSTGLLPDEFNAQAYNAEAIENKYPHLSIQKKEESGTFFVFDDNIISVFIEDELVSR